MSTPGTEIHYFFMDRIAVLYGKVLEKSPELQYVTMVQGRVSLGWFASYCNAKEEADLYEHIPMNGLNIKHFRLDIDADDMDLLTYRRSPLSRKANDPYAFEDRSEVIFRFDITEAPVIAGTVAIIGEEYGRPYVTTCLFLIARNEADACLFLSLYKKAEKEKNKRIIDHHEQPICNFRPMSWDDIYLPGTLANDIRNSVNGFFESMDMYRNHGVDWRFGILLAGPPGNGKTAICRAIATEAASKHAVIYCLFTSEPTSSILEALPDTIANNAPCIVIIEDADAMATDERTRSSFLSMMDGLVGSEGVLTIASTNSPEKLDEAFTGRPGRFDEYHLLKSPEAAERESIIKKRLGKFKKGINTRRLAQEMEGFSGAFVQEAVLKALRESMFKKTRITEESIEDAISKTRKHLQISNNNAGRPERIDFDVD